MIRVSNSKMLGRVFEFDDGGNEDFGILLLFHRFRPAEVVEGFHCRHVCGKFMVPDYASSERVS
jgi:hypothetical protein